MNRLTVPSAVCAAALALLVGCSSEPTTEAGPAATATSTAPSSAPVTEPAASASAPAAGEGNGAALCQKVFAAKAALNEELKGVASADGTVPPAAGKKVMTSLATTLSDLAAAGDGELAAALDALSGEASKAAAAANPMQAALSPSFDAAGQKVDSVCAKG